MVEYDGLTRLREVARAWRLAWETKNVFVCTQADRALKEAIEHLDAECPNQSS